MTEDTRIPRDLETRDSESRDEATFIPAGLLPHIDQQEGYVYRWVRVSARGQSDNANMSARLREGWEPCKATDHPEYQQFADKNSRFKGMIEHGGLLLCKISKEKAAARRKYFANMNARQIEAVDNNVMRESDRRMPMFKERQTRNSNRGDQ